MSKNERFFAGFTIGSENHIDILFCGGAIMRAKLALRRRAVE
jgi:hypothetical protein